MKKKLIYTTLLVSLLSLSTACGKSKSDNKDVSTTDTAMETTAVITNSPLPTAEVSITENSDGTSQLDNATAGYNVSYDSKLLEMSNKDNTISFAPSNEKAKEELNLFLTITETTTDTAKVLGKELKKSYKGSITSSSKGRRIISSSVPRMSDSSSSLPS